MARHSLSHGPTRDHDVINRFLSNLFLELISNNPSSNGFRFEVETEFHIDNSIPNLNLEYSDSPFLPADHAVCLLSESISWMIPVVIGQVQSCREILQSMHQLLYYQISIERPFLIENDHSYLLGYVVSPDAAVLQVIKINGWLSDNVFSLSEATLYVRGDLPQKIFYVRFLNLVISKLLNGLRDSYSDSLFKSPSPTIRFSSNLESLPLCSSTQFCNVLFCRLGELKRVLNNREEVFFSHAKWDTLQDDSLIVVKASGT
jgi:hypothetical protein